MSGVCPWGMLKLQFDWYIKVCNYLLSIYFYCFIVLISVYWMSILVPRSHSVTGNVRSGKVRQYSIFHWLLKKGCGNAIYAPIGLFRGALSEGLVFASSCAVLNKCQLCGGKFCFFRRRKSFTVEENHFKNLRRLCKWYRRKPHVPCHSNKVLRSLLRSTQKLINSS